MAYFKQNESEETRRNRMITPDREYDQPYPAGNDPAYEQQHTETYYTGEEYTPEDDEEYDDGFDEPDEEEPEDELTESEKKELKKERIQLLFGAGDLTGIIAGTVVILLLLAFLFQMVKFIQDDIRDFFTTIGRFFM